MSRIPRLNRRLLILSGLACASLSSIPANAQVNTGLDPYRHTYDADHGYVPVAAGYGGYGGYGFSGGLTPGASAGIAAAGVGQAAEGIGQGRLSTAQAQEAHQTATTQYLQNLQLAQDTALETSAKKEQATKQHDAETKAAISAQVALYNKSLEQMAAAHRLTAEQMDVGTGQLHWPFVLRGSQYDDLRLKIDKLWDARTPDDSGENSSGFDDIQATCNQLQTIVNGEVKKGLPVNDFVTAKHFISSIEYEARFPVKPAK